MSAEGRSPAARVLLIDRQPTSRLLLAAMLRSAGHEVVAVADAGEALAAARQSPFAAVIVDCASVDDAGSLLAELGGAPAPALIATTGRTDPAHLELLARLGFDDVMTRPLDRDAVLARLAACLDGRARVGAEPVGRPDTAFDPAPLDELAAMLRPAALVAIVETFTAEAGQALVEVRAALAAGDLPRVARIAHPLKSSAAGVGAMAVSGLARRLESAGRSGDRLQAERVSADLEAALRHGLDALQAWLRTRD